MTEAGGAIAVRQATIDDVDRLAPLFDGYRIFYGQASDRDLARRFLHERFVNQQSIVFVAERGGAAVGFTQLYPSFSSVRPAKIFVLNDLFVDPSCRKCGAGAALLEAARRYAAAAGAASLTLRTAVDNARAQALYRSLGWQQNDRFLAFDLPIEAG
ncbi:MAG: N-acetyltransferase family protein [Sphingomonadales bacterium]